TALVLGIETLRPLSLIKLSNGQMRRARIARSLLSRAELLILDDPFLCLDAAGRDEVARLLGGIVTRGHRLILLTRDHLVPDWVTNVLRLERPHPSPPALRGRGDAGEGDSLADSMASRSGWASEAPSPPSPLPRKARGEGREKDCSPLIE